MKYKEYITKALPQELYVSTVIWQAKVQAQKLYG